MRIEVDLTVPDRESEEPDMTDRQLGFITSLLSGIGIEEHPIETSDYGKDQASHLINNLIEVRDAGGKSYKEPQYKDTPTKPKSRNSNAPKHSKRETTTIPLLLGIGIFFFPILFCWFTLLPRYSILSKIVSFVWLFFWVSAFVP